MIFAVETRLERALQNRWFAALTVLAIGYVAMRVMVNVAEGFYYDFHVYPQMKGAEYNYPELRYTFGQVAIFLWSVVGLTAAAFAARSALFRTPAKWAARSVITFAFGFIILVVGLIAGMALRKFGL
jgi:hypothetical protein